MALSVPATNVLRHVRANSKHDYSKARISLFGIDVLILRIYLPETAFM